MSDKIYLSYQQDDSTYINDSALITGNQFEFSGVVNSFSRAYIFDTTYYLQGLKHNATSLFLEKGHINIELNSDSFDTYKIHGSLSNVIFKTFLKQKNVLLKKVSQVRKNNSLKPGKKKLQEAVAFNKFEKAELNFCKAHPNLYLSPYLLCNAMSNFSSTAIRSAYTGFTKRIKESLFGRYVKGELDFRLANVNTRIGKRATEFNTIAYNGDSVSLHKELSIGYVLLDFWASWCVPCRKSFPALKTLYAKYHNKGLEVIAVSSDAKNESWTKAIKDDSLSIWTNVRSQKINKDFGVNLIPAKILINRKGTIAGIYRSDNEDQLENDLDKIFNKGQIISDFVSKKQAPNNSNDKLVRKKQLEESIK